MELRSAPEPGPGFSSAKQRVLTVLKRAPGASLREVAEALGVSRSAALRHLTDLEAGRWVQREYRGRGVGRPSVCFRLTAATQPLFPSAYAETVLFAMGFLERTQGRPAVLQMLQERTDELAERHRARLATGDLAARVRALGRIRDEEGYMAEVKRRGPTQQELLEHHCPILAVAERYGEACDIERRLFERLLRAGVRVQHRLVTGHGVCRFVIQEPGRSGA